MWEVGMRKWEDWKVGKWNAQTFGPLGACHSRSASREGGGAVNYQLDELHKPNKLKKHNKPNKLNQPNKLNMVILPDAALSMKQLT